MDALQNHGVSPEQTDTLPAWVDDFNDRVTSPTLPECFAPMKGDLADYSSLLFEYKQLLDVLLNVGLVNRMFHVELAASPRLWLEWAAQNNIHPYIYDYIPSRPDHLWSKPPPRARNPSLPLVPSTCSAMPSTVSVRTSIWTTCAFWPLARNKAGPAPRYEDPAG